MLFSRMLALAPVLMMMGAGGADANAGAFEDDYTAYDEALGVLEVSTPATSSATLSSRSATLASRSETLASS